MKKNNKQVAARGHKRDSKNKKRIKRSTELKDFNNLVGTFKFMQEYVRNAKKQQDANQNTQAK
jgi:hypothetical protein